MSKKKKEINDSLIEELSKQVLSGKPLLGEDGILNPLIRQVLEKSLEAELEEHLRIESEPGNRKNGKGRKNVLSSNGGLEIFTPRDRNGSFEPQLIKKRQRSINCGLVTKILSLYGKGMSYRDIQSHIKEMYDVDISVGTINAITDKIMPDILEWQQRALESVYAVIWLDAMHFKVREAGKVISKAVYSVLGVNCDGEKQVLGIYFGDYESSSYWRNVLYDLQQRGVKDIFVSCIDNLQGFADAIEDVFPQTDVQLCLVQQMRNSLKYANHKDVKSLIKDLRKVYTASNEQAAAQYLEQAREIWGDKYKVVFKSWDTNWIRLTNFYKYPPALRRIIYTNNPIESFHRMVRKTTKTKGAFTSENAIVKQIYLATINANTKWSGTMLGWTSVRNALADYYENRFLTDDTL